MLSIDECKRILNKKEQKYTTEQVKIIRDTLNKLAEVIYSEKATINTKQKLISSIFKEKLVFNGERYRTPLFNKGVELISHSISILEGLENKNERLSFDNLPLCTRDGT